MSETYHGSRERVSWSVTRDGATTLFGEDEDRARADYERRAKTLHRGQKIRLERHVYVESWVQHIEVMENREKS